MPGKLVVIPLNTNEVTYTERRQALEDVNLIKEKIIRIIKERACANVSKQEKFEIEINNFITNDIARGFINHVCAKCIQSDRSSYF